jgi:hypothetical protein
MEEPVPHQALRVFWALAPADRFPLGDIQIPKIHVLDALDLCGNQITARSS